jgi:hypothetical protein
VWPVEQRQYTSQITRLGRVEELLALGGVGRAFAAKA